MEEDLTVKELIQKLSISNYIQEVFVACVWSEVECSYFKVSKAEAIRTLRSQPEDVYMDVIIDDNNILWIG